MRYNTFENNESEEKKLRIFAIFKRKKVQEITPMGNTKEYRVVRCDVPAGKPVFSPVWKGCNFEQRTGTKEKGWEKLMRIVKIAEIRERGDKPFYTGSDREKMPAERSFCIKKEDRCLTGRIKESTDRSKNILLSEDCRDGRQEDKIWFSDDLFCGLSSLRGLNVDERGFGRR